MTRFFEDTETSLNYKNFLYRLLLIYLNQTIYYTKFIHL